MCQDPEETLRDYVSAFETLEPNAIARFYCLPCLFITPSGPLVASDSETALAVATGLVEHAKSTGYHRSEVLDLSVKRLDDRIASLGGVLVRYDGTGKEINRFGFGYTMWHTGTSWRIVVALAHEAPQTTR